MLNLTDATFKEEVLEAKGLVLVDFWAAWCGPCRAIAPTVEAIANKYQGTVKVAKMDVDTNPITPSNYDVRGIPALLFFHNGYFAKSIVGYVDQTEIEEAITKLLE